MARVAGSPTACGPDSIECEIGVPFSRATLPKSRPPLAGHNAASIPPRYLKSFPNKRASSIKDYQRSRNRRPAGYGHRWHALSVSQWRTFKQTVTAFAARNIRRTRNWFLTLRVPPIRTIFLPIVTDSNAIRHPSLSVVVYACAGSTCLTFGGGRTNSGRILTMKSTPVCGRSVWYWSSPAANPESSTSQAERI
jgi:hypothetical protein